MPTCAKREKKRGEKRQDKERERETERNEVCVTISLARKSQRGREQKK